jgi:hypothetical protein
MHADEQNHSALRFSKVAPYLVACPKLVSSRGRVPTMPSRMRTVHADSNAHTESTRRNTNMNIEL